ncbi:MAG: oligosaccharyl transferase, archaeosortase A system-associated, partial [Methanomicrobiales archaeon]|nr:oligosaccharyl transferase, archaeosortase A system-associated [Methanomicrobiales archaeon]
VQYLRFESYFAVNVALLSSLCIVTGLTTGFAKIGDIDYRFWSPGKVVTDAHAERPLSKKRLKSPGKSSEPTKKSSPSKKVKNSRIFGGLIIAVILGITVISVGLSVQGDLDSSSDPGNIISTSWVETMEWLGAHTPDPGIDYLGVYQNNRFTYPKAAYGILSWWDYGHYITFIGKRIPVTNPFQDHLYSSNTAGFYLSGSEADAMRILQYNGVRYVITDTPIATGKFGALVAINGSSADFPLYMKNFFRPNPETPGQLMQFEGKLPPYFSTTLARLHNFDGSMQIPGTVTYLEYHNENRGGVSYPMGTYEKALSVADATNAIQRFEQQPQGDSKAVLVGQYLQPLEPVPALQHFRMVHESMGNSSDIMYYDISGVENLKLVKVFEFVPGAHINGEGTIELNIITNTGREFRYRQESVNGEFIVPYSTVNNPYEVRTNGTYHIVGTTREIDVTEEDLLKGRLIAS